MRTRKSRWTPWLFCLLVGIANAAPPSSGRAPLPAPLLSARKAYLANGGLDAGSLVASNGRMTDLPYDRIYTALQTWGRYDLVTNPADSEVVLEFRVESAPERGGALFLYRTFLSATVYDTRSRFVLWTIKAPMRTFRAQDVDLAIADVVSSLKTLVTAGGAPAK
jgi:hypothetical protein